MTTDATLLRERRTLVVTAPMLQLTRGEHAILRLVSMMDDAVGRAIMALALLSAFLGASRIASASTWAYVSCEKFAKSAYVVSVQGECSGTMRATVVEVLHGENVGSIDVHCLALPDEKIAEDKSRLKPHRELLITDHKGEPCYQARSDGIGRAEDKSYPVEFAEGSGDEQFIPFEYDARLEFARAYFKGIHAGSSDVLRSMLISPSLPVRRAGVEIVRDISSEDAAKWDLVGEVLSIQIGREPTLLSTRVRVELIELLRQSIGRTASENWGNASPRWWKAASRQCFSLLADGDIWVRNQACECLRNTGVRVSCPSSNMVSFENWRLSNEDYRNVQSILGADDRLGAADLVNSGTRVTLVELKELKRDVMFALSGREPDSYAPWWIDSVESRISRVSATSAHEMRAACEVSKLIHRKQQCDAPKGMGKLRSKPKSTLSSPAGKR